MLHARHPSSSSIWHVLQTLQYCCLYKEKRPEWSLRRPQATDMTHCDALYRAELSLHCLRRASVCRGRLGLESNIAVLHDFLRLLCDGVSITGVTHCQITHLN
jgi:hypothetical protein